MSIGIWPALIEYTNRSYVKKLWKFLIVYILERNSISDKIKNVGTV